MYTQNAHENRRLAIQTELDALKTQNERNRMGQFATPPSLALEIIEYTKSFMPSGGKISFLDPAFGTGSFYSALLKVFSSREIVHAEGFEIDPHYGDPATRLWGQTPLKLHIADFTKANQPNKEVDRFNLIVCNPPYVRHHHIKAEEKLRLQAEASRACGVNINGLSGLYCYFLCLSHAWMSANGIAAWLIPSEFMDVNYGRLLKHYLVECVTLLRIHRFDPNDTQFDDALVSSAVVWFQKTKPFKKHRAEFTFGGTVAKPKISRTVPALIIKTEPKWTRVPLQDYDDRKIIGPTLSDFFNIKRGLATGDNNFFILSREKIERYGLPIVAFKSILPSPRYLKIDEIKRDEYGNPLMESLLFLLDSGLTEREIQKRFPSLWKYLEKGKAAGIHERYLCRHRSPWYSQENRPASIFLCTYMGRTNRKDGHPFRFILNHSMATATNVYLLMYPKPVLEGELRAQPSLVYEIWHALKRISPDTMVTEGRVYGGGLHKLEPRELGNVSATEISALLRKNGCFSGSQLKLELGKG